MRLFWRRICSVGYGRHAVSGNVMPVDAKSVFQTEVFHPPNVSPKLQAHLGLTLVQRIFDKYIGIKFKYCHIEPI
jgi:hypothetical protein